MSGPCIVIVDRLLTSSRSTYNNDSTYSVASTVVLPRAGKAPRQTRLSKSGPEGFPGVFSVVHLPGLSSIDSIVSMLMRLLCRLHNRTLTLRDSWPITSQRWTTRRRRKFLSSSRRSLRIFRQLEPLFWSRYHLHICCRISKAQYVHLPWLGGRFSTIYF